MMLLGSLLATFQLQPRAEITDGPQGEVTATTATFTFQASGPAPLTSFECRLDAGAWAECASPHEIQGLGGGPHVFEVRLQGPLADPTPDRREWVVKQRSEVVPCGGKPCPSPLPAPPVSPPPTPPPPA